MRPVWAASAAYKYWSSLIARDTHVDYATSMYHAKIAQTFGSGYHSALRKAFVSGGTAGLQTQLGRSEEHTSDLQSLMRNSYAVFCFEKKKINKHHNIIKHNNKITN